MSDPYAGIGVSERRAPARTPNFAGASASSGSPPRRQADPYAGVGRPQRRPGVVEDSARAGAAGIVQGALGTGNGRNDAANMGARLGLSAALAIGRAAGVPEEVLQRTERAVVPVIDQAAPSAAVLTRQGHPLGVDYEAQTETGRNVQRAARLLPNAAAPGGLVTRLASVGVPYVAGTAGRQIDRSLGGTGEVGEGIGEFAGGVASGSVGRGFRIARIRAPVPAEEAAARALRSNGGRGAADAAAMRARQQQYLQHDIQPTVADITSESGRRTIRAAASRPTPAQDTAREFAEGRATNLPGRMSRQARRVMSSDPRTPEQIRADTTRARNAAADAQFGAVRGEVIDLAPETVTSLRSDYGRAAIREAASRERDPDVRAALNRLADAALDNPGGTQITVGMADRISRVLLSQAEANAKDPDLAGLLRNLGNDVRRPAAAAVPAYGEALENYGAGTRLTEAAATGEDFMARNTDEFVADVGRMSPDERELAQAAARRAVERRSGENVGAAPGVARQIALAPEQQARNAALLGPERAAELQTSMGLEARAVQNAADVTPRTGSQTEPNQANAARIAQVGLRVARQEWLGLAMDWLRTRGLSDNDAQALVTASLDPAMTERVLARLEARLGQGGAQQFLSALGDPRLLTTAGAVSAGMSASQPVE